MAEVPTLMSMSVLLLFSVHASYSAVFTCFASGFKALMISYHFSLSLLRLLQRWFFHRLFLRSVPHELYQFSLFSVCASYSVDLSPRLFLGALMSLYQFLSVLCSACKLDLSPGCSWVSALMIYHFLSVLLLRLLQRWIFHQVFWSVCSHEPLVLSSLCSLLRFLQRWFFHQAVPECLLS
jgi:hypothetical protein